MRAMKAVLALVVTAAVSGCGTATQTTPATQETPATQTTPTASTPSTPSTPSNTAPAAATASTLPPNPEASFPREAVVYSALLDRFLGTELSVGGPSDVDTVYILDRAGLDQGSGGHHAAEMSSPSEISSRVQQAVEASLADDYRIRWIDNLGSVKLTGRIDCVPADKSNVVIALGSIHESGQQIEVSLDGHADCGLAGGWVYRLAQDDGSWKVVKYRASWQT